MSSKVVPTVNGKASEEAYIAALSQLHQKPEKVVVDGKYLERIKDATIIIPLQGFVHHYISPFYGARIEMMRFNPTTSKFELYPANEGTAAEASILTTKETALRLVDGLVAQKVILFPIQTALEVDNLNFIANKEKNMPFEFEVRKGVAVKGEDEIIRTEYSGELMGKVTAREYPVLTKENAESVKQFVEATFARTMDEIYVQPLTYVVRQ